MQAGGVAQSKELVGSLIGCDIGHLFEVVAVRERNVPGDGPAKSWIVDRVLTRVPGEKNLDRDVVPTGEFLIKRHEILNRVGNDERDAAALRHSTIAPACF